MIVLTDEQHKLLVALITQLHDSATIVKAETHGEEPKYKLKGVKGAITIKATKICPEMCFRFQEYGTCVHLEKLPTIDRSYTVEFMRQREEKRLAKIRNHKDQEKSCEWQIIKRNDWKTMPLSYGMYVWVDENDCVVYCAKAVDLRRRHYTWAMLVKTDARWVKTVKIWWLHTGWYEELLKAIVILGQDTIITRSLLECILKSVKPIELLLPEPPVG